VASRPCSRLLHSSFDTLDTFGTNRVFRHDPTQISCLNYAPGPMDTAMQDEIMCGDTVEPSVRQWASELHEQVSLLPAAGSGDRHANTHSDVVLTVTVHRTRECSRRSPHGAASI